MDIKIIEEKSNPLLSRTEIVAKVNFEGTTPARKDLQKEIAKKVKGDENLTVVNTIHTAFGDASAKVVATVYSDESVMMKLERKNLVEKHAGHEPKEEEAE